MNNNALIFILYAASIMACHQEESYYAGDFQKMVVFTQIIAPELRCQEPNAIRFFAGCITQKLASGLIYDNILFEHASYYFPSLPADGIHFTEAGNAQLGRMIAAKAVEIQWFKKNTALPSGIIGAITSGHALNPDNFCNPQRPDLCTTSITCSAMGHSWCVDRCLAGACPPPPPPTIDWAAIGWCFFLGICHF